MKLLTASWNILAKDMRTYYLKPPSVTWGIIFPLAWTGMFFIRSGRGMDSILGILPGVIAISILFGTTSLLAVNITWEKNNRSFERLLLAPIPINLLMISKTAGAIIFGFVNAFVPLLLAFFITDISQLNWGLFIITVFFIATSSTFLSLFIAVTVSNLFEAPIFSNFFRFPMIFLCGLFFPISQLPFFLRPLSYILPLTYGTDALHGSIYKGNVMSLPLNLLILTLFCIFLFTMSIINIKKKWIL